MCVSLCPYVVLSGSLNKTCPSLCPYVNMRMYLCRYVGR